MSGWSNWIVYFKFGDNPNFVVGLQQGLQPDVEDEWNDEITDNSCEKCDKQHIGKYMLYTLIVQYITAITCRCRMRCYIRRAGRRVGAVM